MAKSKDKRSAYQKEVDRIYEQLASIEDQSSEEYQRCLNSLKALTDVECMKIQSTDKKGKYEIGKAIVVGVLGLIQIGAIILYEERNILPGKALSLILRGRV